MTKERWKPGVKIKSGKNQGEEEMCLKRRQGLIVGRDGQPKGLKEKKGHVCMCGDMVKKTGSKVMHMCFVMVSSANKAKGSQSKYAHKDNNRIEIHIYNHAMFVSAINNTVLCRSSYQSRQQHGSDRNNASGLRGQSRGSLDGGKPIVLHSQ